MTVIFEAAIALLAAIGLVSLFWMILGLWGHRRFGRVPVYLRKSENIGPERLPGAANDIRWLRLWGVADIRD